MELEPQESSNLLNVTQLVSQGNSALTPQSVWNVQREKCLIQAVDAQAFLKYLTNFLNLLGQGWVWGVYWCCEGEVEEGRLQAFFPSLFFFSDLDSDSYTS